MLLQTPAPEKNQQFSTKIIEIREKVGWDLSPLLGGANEIEQQNQKQHGAEIETRKNGNLVSYSYSTLILVVVYMVLKCNPEKTESNGHRS